MSVGAGFYCPVLRNVGRNLLRNFIIGVRIDGVHPELFLELCRVTVYVLYVPVQVLDRPDVIPQDVINGPIGGRFRSFNVNDVCRFFRIFFYSMAYVRLFVVLCAVE